MFKALNGAGTFFILQSSTQVYGPSQTLKCSADALLTAPKAATKNYGAAAFQVIMAQSYGQNIRFADSADCVTEKYMDSVQSILSAQTFNLSLNL